MTQIVTGGERGFDSRRLHHSFRPTNHQYFQRFRLQGRTPVVFQLWRKLAQFARVWVYRVVPPRGSDSTGVPFAFSGVTMMNLTYRGVTYVLSSEPELLSLLAILNRRAA